MRVVAMLAAYNEADIIGAVVRHLIDQGVEVYVIDNGSTDGTVSIIEPLLGHGVIGMEVFDGAQSGDSATPRFHWEGILRRKEALAREITADWFIHHDADEFRESPWPEHTLASAIELVDRAGYNAIDFAVLNFWPTHDGFRPGDDVRHAFRHFQVGADYDRVQIKCWKRTEHPIDLASVGGHDVMFPDRRVFPIRFLLRHYPIRSQAHGERKVFAERRARFDPSERARGWHVQYDGIDERHNFIRAVEELTPYDPDIVRVGLQLENRLVEGARSESGQRAAERDRVQAELDVRTAERDQLRAETDRQQGRVDELDAVRADLTARVASAGEAVARLEQELDGARATEERLHGDVTRLNAMHAELERALAQARVALDAERAAHDTERRASEEARGVAAQLTTEMRLQRQAMVRQGKAHAVEARQRIEALQHVEAQLSARSREVDGLRGSWSWRVTRPLRWAHDAVRRLAGLPPV